MPSQPAALMDPGHLVFHKRCVGHHVSMAQFSSANHCDGTRSSHKNQVIPTGGSWRIWSPTVVWKGQKLWSNSCFKREKIGCFIYTMLWYRQGDNSSLGNAINVYGAIQMDVGSPEGKKEKKKKKVLPIKKIRRVWVWNLSRSKG